MTAIHMLIGLPASGKTTMARDIASYGVKRISKDDLRAMLHNGVYTPELETFVIRVRDLIAHEAIKMGFDVVIDDTNLNPIHQESINQLAEYTGAKLDIIRLKTPVDVCIERDAKRDKPVGEDVIRSMCEKWMRDD